jgi:ACT domain-containing protein
MGFRPKVLKPENIQKYYKVLELLEANQTYSLCKCLRIVGMNQTMYYEYKNALKEFEGGEYNNSSNSVVDCGNS